MEKTLERADTRIQKICDALRIETLEPAKLEAEAIIEAAKKQAEEIVREGQRHLESMQQASRKSLENEKSLFHSSLALAAKQSLEELKQTIQTKLFNQQLDAILSKEVKNPEIIAQLIGAMIQAVLKEGLSSDFSAIISKNASPDEVNRLIAKGVLEKLKEAPMNIGDFAGGAKLTLHDKKMTIDISDVALKELFSGYLRKDFRKLLF